MKTPLEIYKAIIKANEEKTEIWLENLEILYETRRTKEKLLDNPYFTLSNTEKEEMISQKKLLEEKIKFKENELIEMQNQILNCQKKINKYILNF